MALLIGHCSEHEEAVAYLPFVEILENFIDRASNADTVRAALGEQASELARLLPKLRMLLPELPPPLDLPPAQARRHLFNCFLDFIAWIAAHQPSLMILEDLHSADDSTLSLLDHLTRRLSELPLMVIGTYRDAELNVAASLAETLESLIRGRLANRIALKGLPRDEVGTMLTSMSGKPAPAAIVAEFLAETEGNPFFVEELFRHLEEENRLYESSGQFRAELKFGELDAPYSVRLVVGRRVDRLSPPTRRMLASAATMGRVFNFEMLRAACGGGPDSLLDCIEEAERSGLIVSVEENYHLRFRFSHELIRQAVIGSLSAPRRRRLHLKIADAIERTCRAESGSADADLIDNHVAELAHHYSRGGNPGKAAEYCLRAVRQLAYVGSNAEALAQFESGLKLLQQLSDDDLRAKLELDFRIAMTDVLGDSKGYASPEAERSMVRAMELGQRQGVYWKKTWLALYGVLFVYLTRPDVPKACEIAEKLIVLAEQQDSIDHVADANIYLAYARMYSGDFQDADRLLERGWSLLESSVNPVDAPTPQRVGRLLQSRELLWQEGTPQNNRGVSALNLWFLGCPDRARERISVATDIALSGIKTMLADVHGFAAYLYDLLREPDRMRASAQARLTLATESGYTSGLALSEIYLGYAGALAGDLEGGLARMKHHLSRLRASGFEAGASYSLALIAVVLGRMARFDEALRAIDESFPIIERTGQRNYEAEVHRLRGELLLAQDKSNSARAEQSFRTAIDISLKQRAKSWELRATTTLARLLRDRGRREEARAMLAEIYGWFTEGFDTADLKDARSLLAELSA
jgi:tetratricopeptide (TPR) repeat protein